MNICLWFWVRLSMLLVFLFSLQQWSPQKVFRPLCPYRLPEGRSEAVPSAPGNTDIGSDERPVPQPSEGQRLVSLERLLLVPTTLINCHLRWRWDRLFPCPPWPSHLWKRCGSASSSAVGRESASQQLEEASQLGVWVLICCLGDASNGVVC